MSKFDLQEVADAWHYANDSGRDFSKVARERFGMKTSQATWWVARIREEGLIPPARPMSKKPSLEQFAAEVKELRESGAQVYDTLQARYSASRTTIYRWLKEAESEGLELGESTKQKKTPEQRARKKPSLDQLAAEVKQLRAEGERVYETLAQRYGSSTSSVHRWVREAEEAGHDLGSHRAKRSDEYELPENWYKVSEKKAAGPRRDKTDSMSTNKHYIEPLDMDLLMRAKRNLDRWGIDGEVREMIGDSVLIADAIEKQEMRDRSLL